MKQERNGMRYARGTGLCAVVAACLVTGAGSPAFAAPGSPGLQPVAGSSTREKPSLPSAFSARLGKQIVKNGKSVSVSDALDQFDKDAKVTVAGGKQITVQELIDRVARAEAQLKSQQSSLTVVQPKVWSKPTTPAKRDSQKVTYRADVAAARSPVAPSAGKTTGSTKGCTAESCAPSDKGSALTWTKSLGDEDIAAAYTSFAVKSETPDAYNAKCSATWDNGVHVLGSKHSLLKFTADVNSSRKPSGFTAGAALYTLGQSAPVWRKEGKVSTESLDRTFSTPKAKFKQPVVPAVTIELEAQASATLSFKPILDGNSSDSGGAQCTLGLTPRLVGSMEGKASIVVGIPDLVELAEGYVKGKVDALDAQVPTSLSLTLKQMPLSLDVRFKSDIETTLLKGKVYLGYKLADICLLGTCLVEDILGIPTKGEYDLWEDTDGFVYSQNLIDKSGAVVFAPR